jgi:hypothetical protein
MHIWYVIIPSMIRAETFFARTISDWNLLRQPIVLSGSVETVNDAGTCSESLSFWVAQLKQSTLLEPAATAYRSEWLSWNNQRCWNLLRQPIVLSGSVETVNAAGTCCDSLSFWVAQLTQSTLLEPATTAYRSEWLSWHSQRCWNLLRQPIVLSGSVETINAAGTCYDSLSF